MNLRNFFAELKRRNVYKVAVAYAVAGWCPGARNRANFSRLRYSKLGCWPDRTRYCVGFPLALAIAWAFEFTPEGLKRTKDVDCAGTAHRPERRVVDVGCGRRVVLMSRRLVLCSAATPHERQQESRLPDRRYLAKSIAVLPFENLSSDKENAYFVDGIQDEILARSSQGFAISRSSRAHRRSITVVAYAVVSWLLIQAASILFPTFEAPAWVMKVFVVVIVALFSRRPGFLVGFRDHAGGNQAGIGNRPGQIHYSREPDEESLA